MMRSCLLLMMVLSLSLMSTGCNTRSDTADQVVQVQGKWKGAITINTCSPSDICEAVGLVQGSTVNATLTLTQDKIDLNGTFSYDGTSLSSSVSGKAGASSIVVNGATSNSQGSATYNISGGVSGNVMETSITNQITLTDGRAAAVAGSGTLARQ